MKDMHNKFTKKDVSCDDSLERKNSTTKSFDAVVHDAEREKYRLGMLLLAKLKEGNWLDLFVKLTIRSIFPGCPLFQHQEGMTF